MNKSFLQIVSVPVFFCTLLSPFVPAVALKTPPVAPTRTHKPVKTTHPVVTRLKHAPRAANVSATTSEDTTASITLLGKDVDGDALTYRVVDKSAIAGVIEHAGRDNLYFIPNENFNGTTSFTYKACDARTCSAAATVTITVTPINDAPVASNVSITTEQETAVAVTLTASDLDGDTLAYTLGTPLHGTFTASASVYTYMPTTGFSGTDTFSYTVSDGALSATASVTATVIPRDTDADGLTDDLDNCDNVANADQADMDSDGEGDACDTDDDGDGMPDDSDPCPTLDHPLQNTDTDSDGLGDICDADRDNDDVINYMDNCLSIANADQTDTDGDGEGDACDTDDDGDGTLDTDEVVESDDDETPDAAAATENDSLTLISAADIADCPTNPEAAACIACLDALYGKTVYVADDASTTLTDFANDEFIPMLKQATNETFTLSTYTDETINDTKAKGIFLVLDEANQSLADVAEESFVTDSKPGRLIFTAKTNRALLHAAYSYLETLGYRWYGSTDHWTITPGVTAICLTTGSAVTSPRFETFSFEALNITGGPSITAADGSLIFDGKAHATRMNRWQNRLRSPRAYKTGGHSYASIYTSGAEEFKSDPLYMPEVDGVRKDYSSLTAGNLRFHYTYHGQVTCDETMTPSYESGGVKLCEDPKDYSSYDGIARLYSEERIATLKTALKRDPDSVNARYISVEPSDGKGDCECAKCRNLLRNGPYTHVNADSSISDRVFHLANQVAKAIATDPELGSDYGVGLYAYGDHASVPDIDFEPNIFVALIPYAYSEAGLPPEDMIDAWYEKKTAMGENSIKLGMYDYLCTIVWAYELPNGCPYQERLDRLNFWAEKKLENVTLEDTNSMGPTGLLHYAGGHEVWEEHSAEKIEEEFYEKAFGPARQPVQDYFSHIKEFTHTLYTVDNMCTSLLEASSLATASGYAEDSDLIKRIDDLMKYAQFLRLAYDQVAALVAAKKNKDYTDHKAKMYDLVKYIWQISDTDMVRAWWIVYYAYKPFVGSVTNWGTEGKDAFWADWTYNESSDKGWADVMSATPLTHGELTRLMTECAALSSVDIGVTDYSDELVPLVSDASGIDPAKRITTSKYLFSNTFRIYARETAKQSLNILVELPDTTTELYVKVLNDEGDSVWKQNYNNETDVMSKITYPIEFDGEAGKLYTLDVTSSNGRYTLDVPLTMPFAAVGSHNIFSYATNMYYFYVPRGVMVAAFDFIPSGSLGGNETFYDPKGVVTTATQNGYNLFALDTSAFSSTGSLWSFKGVYLSSNNRLNLLGVPEVIGFDPQSLLVPKETLNP